MNVIASEGMKKRLTILGSTGSIGRQALDVVKSHPEKFVVEVLTANRNASLLIKQAIEFQPNAVVITEKQHYQQLKDALSAFPVKVFAGSEAMGQVVQMDTVDIVLSALVGFSGLLPTLEAIKAGKTIALANKETLVVAGDLVNDMAAKHGAPIIPVDSEHSAIFQCLMGEDPASIDKIFLTASGGPFRTYDAHQLRHVTHEQALNHPNWQMGNKITIDSASLMNKGLEVIEAKWLFGLHPSQIKVIIHPQSIIHSMVQFCDGSIKAQMGLPDMRTPIQYALNWPDRLPSSNAFLNFSEHPSLTFEKPTPHLFRNLQLAYEALEKGGNMCCTLNAANEIAVAAFLEGKCGFLQMSEVIEHCMNHSSFISKPTLDDYIQTDREARQLASSYLTL